ncbi:Tumor necrosis factor receptor superfamily member 13B, partial [Chaetura pelagica]
AMNNCSEQQYWDSLVCRCIPCSLVCGRPAGPRCAALCVSMDCNRRPGFYYDELLKECMDCRALCGQHPPQCAPTCRGEAAGTPRGWAPGRGARGARVCPRVTLLCSPISAWPTAGALEATPPVAVVEQKACPELEPWLVVYLLLGLCLCALICSLLLGWTHLRRKGEVVSCQASTGTCHHGEDFSKANTQRLFADRLVEVGSVADGSAGSRVPEPVETCGFCFPGHGAAVREIKSCHGTCCHAGERAAPLHTGICSTGSAGAVPSPEDGHFKIICSPSQDKALM